MPIKPENRCRYPKDWPAIRDRILERAEHHCERCKAPNLQMIARGGGDDAGTYMRDDASVYDDKTGALRAACYPMGSYEVDRMVKVVLTIAHLDHTPENCDPSNLRAWCQKCHLAYDAEHHRMNAARTRLAKCPTLPLFPPEAAQ